MTKIAALHDSEIASRLAALEGWSRDAARIVKVYGFANYHETMAFVNAVAWIAHRSDHHPDLEVGYNRCT
ncbi:MAG: 4a-hydroxytetrahydrobiopterin dehydratase, partial [Rhodocyclaceae bacterium]|nr:4a-hydroxytetrahydrobiopterin dehydratase [Rhodocyclaceae bacterium]